MIFSPLADRYFRPVVVLAYYLNYQFAGLSAWTYHLSVVLTHVANAWLVFILGRRLAPERALTAPALAGLLFLVFGGHAEAVTWIGGMADPLVTLFVLGGLVLFDRSLDGSVDGHRRYLYLVGCWAAFAGALLSKESAAIFPGLLVIWLALRAGRIPSRRELRQLLSRSRASPHCLSRISAFERAFSALRS